MCEEGVILPPASQCNQWAGWQSDASLIKQFSGQYWECKEKCQFNAHVHGRRLGDLSQTQYTHKINRTELQRRT